MDVAELIAHLGTIVVDVCSPRWKFNKLKSMIYERVKYDLGGCIDRIKIEIKLKLRQNHTAMQVSIDDCTTDELFLKIQSAFADVQNAFAVDNEPGILAAISTMRYISDEIRTRLMKSYFDMKNTCDAILAAFSVVTEHLDTSHHRDLTKDETVSFTREVQTLNALLEPLITEPGALENIDQHFHTTDSIDNWDDNMTWLEGLLKYSCDKYDEFDLNIVVSGYALVLSAQRYIDAKQGAVSCLAPLDALML